MSSFWVGFDKQANQVTKKVLEGAHHAKSNPSLLGAALGLGAAAIPGTVLGKLHSTRKAKESHEVDAEAKGSIARDAAKARKETPFQYMLNPGVPGPTKEITSRLSRRFHASAAEHPYRTMILPGYGIIRGGKAGEKK